MMYRTLLATGLAALTAGVQAQESDLRGSFGAYLSVMSDTELSDPVDTIDSDGTAFGLRGELGNDTVFAFIDHQDGSQDGSFLGASFDTDTEETRVGLGVRTSDPTLNFSGRLERYDGEITYKGVGGSFRLEDDGAGVHFGIEAKTSDTASLYGSAGVLQLGDSDGPEFRVGIKALVSDQVELFGEYRSLDLSFDDIDADLELTDIRIGGQFRF